MPSRERGPRYNVAPTQRVRTIFDFAPDTMELARLGFVVPWMKGPVINARAESVTTKKTFRDAFRHRRCLMVGDGFIEWKTEGVTKCPFHFTLTDSEVFFFAGL
jgi:putative SOS response-associated peptidase YedK